MDMDNRVNFRNKDRIVDDLDAADSPEIHYTYNDSDLYIQEISELYIYSENGDIDLNYQAFKGFFNGSDVKWDSYSKSMKISLVQTILNSLENSNLSQRLNALRAILYLCQGMPYEYSTLDLIINSIKLNCCLLYEKGTFCLVYKLLQDEIQSDKNKESLPYDISSNAYFRVIFSILYTILETFRSINDQDIIDHQNLKRQFKSLLIEEYLVEQKSSIIVCIMSCLTKFCSISSPHIPIRKALLLLWKIILFTNGGIEDYRKLREEKRISLGLSPSPDDSTATLSQMRAWVMVPFPLTGPYFTGINNKIASNPIKNTTTNDSSSSIVNERVCAETKSPGRTIPISMTKKSPLAQQIDDEIAPGEAAIVSSMEEDDLLDHFPLPTSDEVVPNVNCDAKEGCEPLPLPSGLTEFGCLSLQDSINLDAILKVAALPSHLNAANPEEGQMECPESIQDVENIEAKDIEIIGQETEEDDNLSIVSTATLTFERIESFQDSKAPANEEGVGKGEPSNESLPGGSNVAYANSFAEQSRKIALLNDRKLLWAPKVKKADVLDFLNKCRQKFVGYTLEDDISTLVGLPKPIHDSFHILKKYMHISIAEVELEMEKKRELYPYSHKESDIPQTPIEMIYQSILPNLSNYMICLLKILLATSPAPSCKPKTESINIKNDVIPPDLMKKSPAESAIVDADVRRHKEVIAKAVSGILILLLKHLKINHIYQYEYCCQQLVFANCVPLILKYFNQEVKMHLSTSSECAPYVFPNTFLSLQKSEEKHNGELNCYSISRGEYSWRNLFTSINLLRVLNMLVKGKQSRIMMLLIFGSSPILKKTLKIREITFQVYVLKLLKLQMRYLGRQWRKSNMKILGAVYQKVRHHLNDDWAYGNYTDSQPLDFQADENPLKEAIERFNKRRYGVCPGQTTPTQPNKHDQSNDMITNNICNDQQMVKPPEISKDFLGALLNVPTESSYQSSNVTNKRMGDFDNSVGESGNQGGPQEDKESVENDSCLSMYELLAQPVQLSSYFKQNYEKWLEKEVFSTPIDWDRLLIDP